MSCTCCWINHKHHYRISVSSLCALQKSCSLSPKIVKMSLPMWDLIGCEKELGLVENTKSSGSGNTYLCILNSFTLNLPNLVAEAHKLTTTTSSLPILPARFCDFLTCWSSKILPQFFSDSRRNFCDVTFLLFVELAFWDLVLKHGYKGYKTGREVHKKLRIFPNETRVLQQHGSLQNFGELVKLTLKTNFSIFR